MKKNKNFKKFKKGKLKQFKYNSTSLTFGILGLKAVESGFLNSKQLESARIAISRKTKRKIKLWIKLFTNVFVTKKSAGARMGKGKGSFSHFGAKIKGGTVLFEICGANIKNIVKALQSGAEKLPFKTKIIN